MTKKLVITINIMLTSLFLNSMKLELPSLKRTKTVAQGSQSRRPEDSENKQDVRLNFENLPEPMLSSTNGKRSVKRLNQVQNLRSQQETFRTSTGRGSTDGQKERRNVLEVNNNNGEPQGLNSNLIVKDDEEDGEIGVKQGDSVKIKRRSVLGELSPHNTFSSQDMWEMLKKANPKLYEYAIDNQLSINEVLNCSYDLEALDPQVHNALKELGKKKPLTLDRMMEYAHLLDHHTIEPEVVAELLQHHHGFSDDYTQLLAKKFENIQKKDPETYLSIALDFLSRTCDDSEIKSPSPIHAAHVAIQKDAIANEKQQKLYSVIALGITLLTTLAGYGWAIYGQVSGTATHAPTNAPTNAPTMFPTGSPT